MQKTSESRIVREMSETLGELMQIGVIYRDTGATFSTCRTFRYTLWRIWNANVPPLLCILLNPSTADEVKNDPTVERCERRAISGGFGGLIVCNAFALRSTDPGVLRTVVDPVGPDNDDAILKMAKMAGQVVCGWGTHGNFMNRGKTILELLRRNNIKIYCLGQNKDGTPKHPLYIGYKTTFRPLL